MKLTRAFILASSSPRRIELLKTIGVKPVIHKPDVDETPIKDESAKKMVKRLSRLKARSVAKKIIRTKKNINAIIVAADTTVVSPEGKILGKPDKSNPAAKMLTTLSGKTHKVHTAYHILEVEFGSVTTELTRVVTTFVKMRDLSSTEIQKYINTGEPHDKAGAYAAQGVGMTIIQSIKGSYTNVVGLPMTELVLDLRDFFEYEP